MSCGVSSPLAAYRLSLMRPRTTTPRVRAIGPALSVHGGPLPWTMPLHLRVIVCLPAPDVVSPLVLVFSRGQWGGRGMGGSRRSGRWRLGRRGLAANPDLGAASAMTRLRAWPANLFRRARDSAVQEFSGTQAPPGRPRSGSSASRIVGRADNSCALVREAELPRLAAPGRAWVQGVCDLNSY